MPKDDWYSRPGNKERKMEYQRRRRREIRLIVIEGYGGACVCCGESRLEFLALDHVDGKGNEDRRQKGGNYAVYEWAIKEDFPESLQLLCHNCNQSKGYYGYCPHEVENA